MPRSLIVLPRDPTIGLTQWAEAMGYNQRNDEIRDNVTRMRREWEAQWDALATVRRFDAILSAKGYSWFWPRVNPPSKQSKSPAQSGASVQIQARRSTPL